jgi:ABC-type phosphate transport system substrate-binding protein
MKNKIFHKLFFLCALLFSSSYSFAELAVIVHPGNSLQAISKDELKRIYLGKSKEFPNGLLIAALDQDKESEEKKEFYKKVVGKSLSQVSAYWSRLIFTGKGVPPRVLLNDEEVKKWVASHPESIAYINAESADDSIKVILDVK